MTVTPQDLTDRCFRTRSPWSQEEACRAAAMWKAGATAVQIADQLGKTRNAVLGKIGRLGLARTTNGQARRPRAGKVSNRLRRGYQSRGGAHGWTPERDSRLESLWHEDLSCDEIAVRLATTESAVEIRLTQRGLMEPECPEAFTGREWFARNEARFRAAMNRAVKRGDIALPADEVPS